MTLAFKNWRLRLLATGQFKLIKSVLRGWWISWTYIKVCALVFTQNTFHLLRWHS